MALLTGPMGEKTGRKPLPRSAPPPAPIGCGWLPLPHGLFALVDAGMLPELSAFNWQVDGSGHVRRTVSRGACRGRTIFLHQSVAQPPPGVRIDHANGDPMDNRLCNLRFATQRQNVQNARRRSDNKSGFKGVGWHTAGHKWTANIRANGVRHYLGLFTTREAAARAYDAAASRLFGHFARLNFPEAP